MTIAKKIGPANLLRRCERDLQGLGLVQPRAFLFLRQFAMADGVFGHDDARVHQHANGDGDAGERHDVRRDAELVHQDERNQNRKRQRQRDDEDAAEMEQENDDDERDEDGFLGQRVLERVERARQSVRCGRKRI